MAKWVIRKDEYGNESLVTMYYRPYVVMLIADSGGYTVNLRHSLSSVSCFYHSTQTGTVNDWSYKEHEAKTKENTAKAKEYVLQLMDTI